jgi:hypothetical protein
VQNPENRGDSLVSRSSGAKEKPRRLPWLSLTSFKYSEAGVINRQLISLLGSLVYLKLGLDKILGL